MSYIALYRKYRPRDFRDVVGQDHIVRTLGNQIKSNRVSHAYLFCGTRGTGKTSVAKIFAQVVNCEDISDEGESCGKCRACLEIQAGRSMNIIEIDAASNNGVDNIREIREEVRYAPTQGKYKVYIIDEVHMLSTGAFNALLKTLEEPPSHVIFILATTDPQKIPVTILSRCQRFDFRRITTSDITKRLEHYMKLEGVEADHEAIDYIAYLADGGMRDALSVLDQCISFYFGEKITLNKVLQLLGAVDKSVFFELTQAVVARDSQKAISICEDINTRGRDIHQFVLDGIVHFRNLLVAKSTSDPQSILDYSSDYVERLTEQAKEVSATSLMRYIRIFSDLDVGMKGASKPRILLEVSLLKLCEPSMEVSNDAILERIASLEKKADEAPGQVVYVQEGGTRAIIEEEVVVPKVKPKAVPEDIKQLIKSWEPIKSGFSPMHKSFLIDVKAGYLEDTIFYLIFPNHTLLQISQTSHDVMIREALEKAAGKSISLKYITIEDYEKEYKQIYGPKPGDTDETKDINETIKVARKAIQFPIEVE
ncbi:MAG TPA: DNA polymerase III subunit gamma/tau [Epulopiscium sp.]|nr:DNA polymerase III subunit gamma/tau [Candidatus Epulonipiscium sp.]